MTRYTLGFLFKNNDTEVLLIRKNRPEWQAGYLNGIGGKMHTGEHPDETMAREANEEAGIHGVAWQQFATMNFAQATVRCYRAHWAGEGECPIIQNEDEQVGWYYVDSVMAGIPPTVPNLRWLIPLALDKQAHFTMVSG